LGFRFRGTLRNQQQGKEGGNADNDPKANPIHHSLDIGGKWRTAIR
jgi:hypothetical protein